MRRRGMFAATVAALVCVGTANAASWSGHQVGRVFPPDYRDCIYFELVGVSQADPAVPVGAGWFALPRAQTGFKEIYALLLTAKATGVPLNVVTTGQQAGGQCGAYAGVHQLYTAN